jgi:hypothetical protein
MGDGSARLTGDSHHLIPLAIDKYEYRVLLLYFVYLASDIISGYRIFLAENCYGWQKAPCVVSSFLLRPRFDCIYPYRRNH